MTHEAAQTRGGLIQRKIIAVKPIEHRRPKGELSLRSVGLSDGDRTDVREVAQRVKKQLLPGRTIIACTPTICGQEMAHIFSGELTTVMPIACQSLNSRKPHNAEPHNLQEMLSFIRGLIPGYENIVLITHVGDMGEHQIFSSYFFEKHLNVISQHCDILAKGRVVAVDCQL